MTIKELIDYLNGLPENVQNFIVKFFDGDNGEQILFQDDLIVSTLYEELLIGCDAG